MTALDPYIVQQYIIKFEEIVMIRRGRYGYWKL